MEKQWKDVPGYEGLYLVSSLGEIKSLWRKTKPHELIKTWPNSHGYSYAVLSRGGKVKKVTIHRLVAIAFCPGRSSDKWQVNHKNGIKSDNSAKNLEWCTPTQNRRHALSTGLVTCAKLKSSDIPIIRKMSDDKIKQKDIAAKFGVNRKTIWLILNNRAWTHS